MEFQSFEADDKFGLSVLFGSYVLFICTRIMPSPLFRPIDCHHAAVYTRLVFHGIEFVASVDRIHDIIEDSLVSLEVADRKLLQLGERMKFSSCRPAPMRAQASFPLPSMAEGLISKS